MVKHIPNLLTMLRIILVPVFLYNVFWNSHPLNLLWAMIFFVIAAISDYWDGRLARDLNIVSNFGKIMDPLADKILVISALVALMIEPMPIVTRIVHPVVFGVIVFREIAVTILREYYVRKQIFIPANFWGKLKTTFQLTAIITSLVYFATVQILNNFTAFAFPIIYQRIELGLVIFFWLVALVTILSGLTYFVRSPKK